MRLAAATEEHYVGSAKLHVVLQRVRPRTYGVHANQGPPPLFRICSRTLMDCFVPLKGPLEGGDDATHSVTSLCGSPFISLSADVRY